MYIYIYKYGSSITLMSWVGFKPCLLEGKKSHSFIVT